MSGILDILSQIMPQQMQQLPQEATPANPMSVGMGQQMPPWFPPQSDQNQQMALGGPGQNYHPDTIKALEAIQQALQTTGQTLPPHILKIIRPNARP